MKGLNIQSDVESKKLRKSKWEMTTPFFLLLCVHLGISIRDLDLLTIGLVNDMYCETVHSKLSQAVRHHGHHHCCRFLPEVVCSNEHSRSFLWGTRVGVVYQENLFSVPTFSYDSNFIRSGIEVAPITMPLGNQVYSFPGLAEDTFHGLPGLLSDSLPDKFGTKLIERYLAFL